MGGHKGALRSALRSEGQQKKHLEVGKAKTRVVSVGCSSTLPHIGFCGTLYVAMSGFTNLKLEVEA